MPHVLPPATLVVPLEERIDGAHRPVLQVVADMPVHADALMPAHRVPAPRLVVLLQQMQQAVLGGVGRLLQVDGLVGVRQSDGDVSAHLVYPELGPPTAGGFVDELVVRGGGCAGAGAAVVGDHL